MYVSKYARYFNDNCDLKVMNSDLKNKLSLLNLILYSLTVWLNFVCPDFKFV